MNVKRLLLAGSITGILFGLCDAVLGFISMSLFQLPLFASDPALWKTTFNPVMGLVVDFIYGLLLALIFAVLYPSLPGRRWGKGLSFALILWFLRVVMGVVSMRVMLNVPDPILGYWLVSGLAEMLVLGLALSGLYRLTR